MGSSVHSRNSVVVSMDSSVHSRNSVIVSIHCGVHSRNYIVTSVDSSIHSRHSVAISIYREIHTRNDRITQANSTVCSKRRHCKVAQLFGYKVGRSNQGLDLWIGCGFLPSIHTVHKVTTREHVCVCGVWETNFGVWGLGGARNKVKLGTIAGTIADDKGTPVRVV